MRCSNCGYNFAGKAATVKAWSVVLIIYVALFIVFYIAAAPNGNRTVYITRNGECYHRSDCSSLSYSKYKTTLESAVADGYRVCHDCDPPQLISNDSRPVFTLSLLIEALPAGILVSVFVWGIAVTIFHLLGIPTDQLKLRWYLISTILFCTVLLFVF